MVAATPRLSHYAPGEPVEFYRPRRRLAGMTVAAGWSAGVIAPSQPECPGFVRVLSGLNNRPWVVPVGCVRRVSC